MDAQDIIQVGRKAKSETESFINRYFNDRAKGWPKLCFCDSLYTGDRRQQRQRRRNNY
jgi:hypothetical protein